MSDARVKGAPAPAPAPASGASGASGASHVPAVAAGASPSSTGNANANAGAIPAKEPVAKDVVLLGPPTADGAGVHVLRARDERLEVGELRGIQEGRPITGELVTLEPRKDNPRICDVKDSYAPPAAQLGPQKGPAKVATDAYRDGWDEVFGKKAASTLPPSQLN